VRGNADCLVGPGIDDCVKNGVFLALNALNPSRKFIHRLKRALRQVGPECAGCIEAKGLEEIDSVSLGPKLFDPAKRSRNSQASIRKPRLGDLIHPDANRIPVGIRH